MRTYELMFISDPRVPDEDVIAMTEDIQGMLTANGGEVIRVEQWGRRRLAYEIDKLKEGKYTLLYLAGEDGQIPIGEVELRMRQNDRIVRYLTVRTDLDLKRAGLPQPTEAGPEPETTEGEATAEGGTAPTRSAATPAASAEKSAAGAETPAGGGATTTGGGATATEPAEGKE
ncbi:MAG TPA: 30S ribosomal protein S6 [Thermoanaerobaculia bacterium]|nr:30S ribosomal protein S6 [Thermoanaerobaculia bacterium]